MYEVGSSSGWTDSISCAWQGGSLEITRWAYDWIVRASTSMMHNGEMNTISMDDGKETGDFH